MPELATIIDCDTPEDKLAVWGDPPGPDPAVTVRGYEQDDRTDVILDRQGVARLVVALDAWLQDTAADRAEHYTTDQSTYPEATPHVVVPDYDAPTETGRAVRLSGPDGLVNIECGRMTTTAANGDAVKHEFVVDGSTMVPAADLIRALAYLLPLEAIQVTMRLDTGRVFFDA